ncbi:hypothetical protein Q1695_003419 [Nippostrongylus brasiliensis]|nr:hypothetical protein Q1695_003419 [Nippostrongylus brasiliensis]
MDIKLPLTELDEDTADETYLPSLGAAGSLSPIIPRTVPYDLRAREQRNYDKEDGGDDNHTSNLLRVNIIRLTKSTNTHSTTLKRHTSTPKEGGECDNHVSLFRRPKEWQSAFHQRQRLNDDF